MASWCSNSVIELEAMDFHQHFTADTALATHRRQDTDKLLRLIPGKHTNEFWHELCDAVVEQTEIIPLHERLTQMPMFPFSLLSPYNIPKSMPRLPFHTMILS